MSWPTPQQQDAIAARGDVLVVAGAGAGKTRTLVDRCLAWLLDAENPGSVDQILMVTFTEAAAAEMRQRLRAGLESIQAARPSARVAEQLALLETAWICTLHSFCFRLVREHFYTLGLDPQLIVLPDERAQLLERQALDSVLDQNYSRDSAPARAIQETIQSLGGDSDAPARALVLRLHHYAQTLPDPAAWFATQTAQFQQPAPGPWLGWLMAELENCRRAWLPLLRAQPPDNDCARQCAAVLDRLPQIPSRAEFAAALDAISHVADDAKPKWRKPLENILAEARFLGSVCAVENTDPLAEDWEWSAPAMAALLDLTQQFGQAYRAAKRDAGGIDFHDLEQFALQLLRDPATGRPGPVAAHWRAKLRLIFVDEFQDINRAQEAILRALGREGAEANRFLVGDIKQSIYRFRLADPRIFLDYQRAWETQPGARVIWLSDNFRSQQGILEFVNNVFAVLMRREVGGIEYDAQARLRFGTREDSSHSSHSSHPPSMEEEPPPVELLLRRTGRAPDEEAGSESSDVETISDTEMEARLIAGRLMQLKDTPLPVQPPRRATWSDMVILLRSPRNKAEAYVKEFARLGVPLAAVRGGFYESLEVRDLLSLLQVLDNPSQDLPLLGVLRSPLAGLTADELASIRLAKRPARFWAALLCWGEAHPEHERVAVFLRRFRAWRKLSRLTGVSALLEQIVEETGFGQLMAGAPDAAQRAANVSRLIHLTQQFDGFRGEGLYRFLQFVQAQQENELDVEPAGQPLQDAVRLMSIHQSKGLEFPIVVLADLGKRFNLDDTRGRVILDEELGLCPQVKPPGHSQFYPSLPHWLAQRRQKRETLGEELRLLYVALTRAADRLILCGTARHKTISEKWPQAAERGLGAPEILAGRSFLDWLGAWLSLTLGQEALSHSGRNSLLTWHIVDDQAPQTDRAALPTPPGAHPPDAAIGSIGPIRPIHPIQPPPDSADGLLREARSLSEWRYAHEEATRRAAKTSVSELRRLMAEEDEESEFLFTLPHDSFSERRAGELTPSEIGSAHHAFLERVDLSEAGSAARLRDEAARLRREGVLSEAQATSLDFDALANFWQSEVGRQLQSERDNIRRELAFTARFTPAELDELQPARTSPSPPQTCGGEGRGEEASTPTTLSTSSTTAADEFIIVQGVIDLAVIKPDEIWVLDYKTDHFAESELEAKVHLYRPQLTLYARAISRIYARPVTRRWLHFLAVGRTVELEGDSV
jgi:ATP-dependent helicase/nuclease subunit A